MASEILQIKPQVEYDMYQTSGATRVRVTSEDKKAQTMKALRSLTIAIAIPLSLTLFIIVKFGSPKRYRTIMAKPIWFPPLWLINLASIGSSFSMSLAAWFVWVNRGFHMNSDALPLYISQISLSIVWHPLQLINDSVWFGFLWDKCLSCHVILMDKRTSPTPRLPPNPCRDEFPFHCWYNGE
ncbi:hypothetical protein Gotur_026116 [Gossypium turneri]